MHMMPQQADVNSPEGEQAQEMYGQAYEILTNTEDRKSYDKDLKDKHKVMADNRLWSARQQLI